MDASAVTRLEELCDATLRARISWLGTVPELKPIDSGQAAIRLFNGFYEGMSELVVDLYGRTLVLFGYAEDQAACRDLLKQAELTWRERLPNVTCVVKKMRRSMDPSQRRGAVSYGGPPDDRAYEQGVWYALDLLMNKDTSLYLDTRPLRSWLLRHADGREILNTFAYTGSLGVAALAGGARRVVQLDRNRKYLSLARDSAMLNRLDLGRMKLLGGDFFSQVGNLRRRGDLFDMVILDPPLFAESEKGRVDLERESSRLINKVRPLVKDGGWLAAVNNALYLSGADYLAVLEGLCRDGYLNIEEILPIPADVCGFPETIFEHPPVDPEPFNHPTKIVLLSVRKKG
jgi:23S rRNA (cytosine1962-C5)-methyltransferase